MTHQSLLLAFWILGILFPMAWLTRFSATYNRIFQYVFTPAWTHVVMHLFLFGVLAYLLGHVLGRRSAACAGRHVVGVVLALVLGVALLQESIQWLYTAQVPGVDEVIDPGVDLVGGSVGVMALQWRVWRSCRRAEGEEHSFG